MWLNLEVVKQFIFDTLKWSKDESEKGQWTEVDTMEFVETLHPIWYSRAKADTDIFNGVAKHFLRRREELCSCFCSARFTTGPIGPRPRARDPCKGAKNYKSKRVNRKKKEKNGPY